MQTSCIDASTKYNEKTVLDGKCYAKMDQVLTRDADGLPKERGPIIGCGCMKPVNRSNNHVARDTRQADKQQSDACRGGAT